MALIIPTDERISVVEITTEEILIPAGTPYQERLLECPSGDAGVTIRRIAAAIKTGTGSGTMISGGTYTGLTTKSYKVEIDTAGNIGVGGATFKWYRDDVLQSSLIPIEDTDPIPLELGITVAFSSGTGQDFELADYWEFDAECWTEVTSIPIASMQFQVDYSNGMILFHSDDAEKTIYTDYSGRGSIVKAADIEQVIDVLNAGEVAIREIDTSAFTVNKAVGLLAAGAYQYANATGGLKPAIGFVKVSDVDHGEIVTHGGLSGFTGLTPEAIYYLDISDGEITLTKRQAGQVVGRAISATELFVDIEAPYVPGDCLSLSGKCNSDMVASTTDIYSSEFVGFGDDYFNLKFYIQVIKNANSVGNAPEKEVRKITDYVSTTGKIVCDAFTVNVEANDDIMLIHESIVAIGRNDADNIFDSSTVAANEDGSILERLEWIQSTLGGSAGQLRTQPSESETVEENAVQQFSIAIFDADSGAIVSANINITAISAVMEKSTGGGAFSVSGITQPTFLKADGRVYCAYQFLAAEWQMGDMYKLTVSGITATIDGDTAYIPAMVWSNLVVEALTLKTQVEAIQTDIGNPSARTNLQTLEAMLGNPDAAGKTIYANIGDFIGRTNLQSLLAVLGNPDAAGKTIWANLGDFVGRTNLQSLLAVLGNPDAAGKSLYGNLGDFVGQTHLQSLLAALGIPDVSAKPLYTCLVTDRLDHGTYGLAALEALINAKVAGRAQMKAKTIDLQQAAGTYDLFTGTTQDVVIEALSFRLPNVNVSDDVNITSISIQTNDATPQVLVSSVIGAKTNLTAEAQLGWDGVILLKTGKKIQLTITGGAADAQTVCDVIAKCRSIVSGGYLT